MYPAGFSKLCFATLSVLFISSCGSDNPAPEPSSAVAPVEQQVALNSRGQEIYDTNCNVCHGAPGTGAPVSGKVPDWSERTKQGMDAMLDNVWNGYNAMPAMGGCFDCSEDDFRQLILFMAGHLAE